MEAAEGELGSVMNFVYVTIRQSLGCLDMYRLDKWELFSSYIYVIEYHPAVLRPFYGTDRTNNKPTLKIFTFQDLILRILNKCLDLVHCHQVYYEFQLYLALKLSYQVGMKKFRNIYHNFLTKFG